MNRHGVAAHVVDHRLVDGKAGIGIDDFITSINKRQHRKENNRLTTSDDYNFIASDWYISRAAHIFSDRLAQVRKTGGRTVVGPALMQSSYGSFDDVVGSVEIGFADLEMNDFFSLALQSTGLVQDFESGFSAQPGHAVSEAQFILGGSCHRSKRKIITSCQSGSPLRCE